MIRHRRLFECAILVVAASILACAAAQADTAYIRSKLQFYYIARPLAPTGTPEAVDVQQVLNSSGRGEFYSDRNCRQFRRIVRAICGGTAAGIDAGSLRTLVEKLLRITNRSVKVYFIKDHGVRLSNDSPTWYDVCIDDGHCWPCCSPGNPASISMGSFDLDNNANYPDFVGILATFCHELMHSQDMSVVRTHMYGNYYYGVDRNHYFDEAIPDMSMTYKEGLANFAEYWCSQRAATWAIDWFVFNSYLVVEKTVPAGFNPDLFLYNTLRTATPPIPDQASGADRDFFARMYGADHVNNYAFYHIRDLPVDVLRQNETIIALILYYHAWYTSFDDVLAAMRQVNPAVRHQSASAFAELIEAICAQQTSLDAMDEHLFTLALCDYFTYFKSNSQTEFARIFENQLSTPLIQQYWSRRPEIRQAVPDLNNLSDEDVTRIAGVLGMTHSRSRSAGQ